MATLSLAALAVAVRNYTAVKVAEERRRVRWVLAAVIAATVLMVVNTVTVPRLAIVPDTIFEVSTTVVPAAFAYAIVRHRVFDISVAVRIGVRYLVARNALRALIALPFVTTLVMLIGNPNVTVRQILFEYPAYPLLGIAAAGTLATRHRLARAIDRRFFRDAHDRERLLESLCEDVERMENASDSLKQIAARLEMAVRPAYIMIWLREDGGEFRLAHSRGESHAPSSDRGRLPPAVVHNLEHDAAARQLDSSPGGYSGGLMVPTVGRDGRLRGLLLMGAKRSEEIYTPDDVRLLQRIARQMGAAWEHAELYSRISDAQRERTEVLVRLEPMQASLLRECPRCGACYDGSQDRCDRDGAELTLSLPVERLVSARYRLEHLIGRGGMGAVYEATDLRLERIVAVKIMLGRHFGDQEALRRFDREARAVARLSHPNIISVFDYGTLAREGAFLVMERVHAATMRTEMMAASTSMQRRRGWIEQILDGVAAAHAHGVVHRDLKPENMLVAPANNGRDAIKLLDFGLAKLRNSGEVTASVTGPGRVLGTLAYMAPEQLLGQTVDERTDIFALGVIVFELLSGQRPFADDPLLRLAEVQRGMPNRVLQHTAIQRVLLRCLAPEPADRYDKVVTLRAELLPLIDR
jgi:hypothetical protein